MRFRYQTDNRQVHLSQTRHHIWHQDKAGWEELSEAPDVEIG